MKGFKDLPGAFPGGLVVKTPCFCCRGHGFNLCLELRFPHAACTAKINKPINLKSSLRVTQSSSGALWFSALSKLLANAFGKKKITMEYFKYTQSIYIEIDR